MSPGAPDNSLQTLVTSAQRGDAAAFAALIAQHERTALAVAYAKLHDAAAAGDVAQDAFLKAWQNLRTLESPASFPGWLAQIVRNLTTDHLRRKKENPNLDTALEIAAPDVPPSEQLARQETARAIDAAISQLDPVTREIVTLRYFDNLPSREIAARVGLSPAAVDMRLSRGRQELKDALDPLAMAGERSPAKPGGR